MRHPLQLLRELGLRNFLAFQLLVGGTMMSAVVHPFFMSLVLFHASTGELFMPGETSEHSARKVLALCVLGVGYFGAIAIGLAGLKRRGMLRIAWVVLTIPIYWLFMSFAAWRALWQFVRAPYHGKRRTGLRVPLSGPSGGKRQPTGAQPNTVEL
jgi:glycosyltransferase XagB